MRPALPLYGVANLKDIAGMTGKEILQAMSDGRLPAPPIARTLTFTLIEVGDGVAVFEGEPGPHLLNPAGTVHGGWALTMIDTATACAVQTLLPAGVGLTTIETKANFSRPITPDTGRVRVKGRALGRGRQIMSAEAQVLDSAGRLLAHGTSTVFLISNKGDARPSQEAPTPPGNPEFSV
jgi:uncharacterized protein (TIGR00369 family)